MEKGMDSGSTCVQADVSLLGGTVTYAESADISGANSSLIKFGEN